MTGLLKTLFVTAFAPTLLQAQSAEPITIAWRSLATADATAALTLIEQNHPGAAPELKDSAFRAQLLLARSHLASRLPLVTDQGGYSAVINGLAADFADEHIWTRPTSTPRSRRWAGIALAYRAGKWIVAGDQMYGHDVTLKGAEITTCDGNRFAAWAMKSVADFFGDAKQNSVLVKAAPVLLTDFDNPFMRLPTTCSFNQEGTPRQVTLTWRTDTQATYQAAIDSASPPVNAGVGLARFSRGYWLGLGTLSGEAQKLIDAAAAAQAGLRDADLVVIDLRGNGGGDSSYGDKLASILVGEARAQAAQPPDPSCGGAYWRVSPGNLKTVRFLGDRSRSRHDPAMAAEWDQTARDMSQALTQHRNFSPALPLCADRMSTTGKATQPTLPQLPSSAMHGRLVLVTDHSCFSSCLILVDLFRRLGAIQVGEPTDHMTRFEEVREELMPSGLRTFSTLQKVVVGGSGYGPYAPDQTFPGDFADSAALQSWVRAQRFSR